MAGYGMSDAVAASAGLIGVPVLLFKVIFEYTFSDYALDGWVIWLLTAVATLSADMLMLVLAEMLSLFAAPFRSAIWQYLLQSLCVLLYSVVPYSTLQTLYMDAHMNPYIARLLALATVGILLYGYSWLGRALPIVTTGSYKLLSIEGAISRLAASGMFVAAVLSGYAAVSTPAGQLRAWLYPIVDASTKVSEERQKVTASLHGLLKRKGVIMRQRYSVRAMLSHRVHSFGIVTSPETVQSTQQDRQAGSTGKGHGSPSRQSTPGDNRGRLMHWMQSSVYGLFGLGPAHDQSGPGTGTETGVRRSSYTHQSALSPPQGRVDVTAPGQAALESSLASQQESIATAERLYGAWYASHADVYTSYAITLEAYEAQTRSKGSMVGKVEILLGLALSAWGLIRLSQALADMLLGRKVIDGVDPITRLYDMLTWASRCLAVSQDVNAPACTVPGRPWAWLCAWLLALVVMWLKEYVQAAGVLTDKAGEEKAGRLQLKQRQPLHKRPAVIAATVLLVGCQFTAGRSWIRLCLYSLLSRVLGPPSSSGAPGAAEDGKALLYKFSFGLLSTLVVVAVRGFFVSYSLYVRSLAVLLTTLTGPLASLCSIGPGRETDSRRAGGQGHGIGAAALLMAHLTGLNFLAFLVTVRQSLPEPYRGSVTRHLGQTLNYQYMHKIFDGTFVAAASIAFIVHLISWTGVWEHRSASAGSQSAGVSSGGRVDGTQGGAGAVRRGSEFVGMSQWEQQGRGHVRGGRRDARARPVASSGTVLEITPSFDAAGATATSMPSAQCTRAGSPPRSLLPQASSSSLSVGESEYVESVGTPFLPTPTPAAVAVPRAAGTGQGYMNPRQGAQQGSYPYFTAASVQARPDVFAAPDDAQAVQARAQLFSRGGIAHWPTAMPAQPNSSRALPTGAVAYALPDSGPAFGAVTGQAASSGHLAPSAGTGQRPGQDRSAHTRPAAYARVENVPTQSVSMDDFMRKMR